MSGAAAADEGGTRVAALAMSTLTLSNTSPFTPSTGRGTGTGRAAARVRRRLGRPRRVTMTTRAKIIPADAPAPVPPPPSSPPSSRSSPSSVGVGDVVPRRPAGVAVCGLLLVLLSSATTASSVAGDAAAGWIRWGRRRRPRCPPRRPFSSSVIGRHIVLHGPDIPGDPHLSVRGGGDAEDAAAAPAVAANPQDGSEEISAPDEGGDSSKGEAEEGAAPDASTVWEELVESTRATFPECPVQDLLVPCDLETFHSMFLSDDAPHPIADYQETRVGDSDLVTTPWTAIGSDDSGDDKDGARLGGGDALRGREITYVHPVSNPMAPPKAKATKRQFLKRFFSSSAARDGGGGIIMETVTTVQDVPKTDCFYVEDRLIVSPTSSDREVRVEARFGIRFIKKTMVRSIIQRSTTKEFNAWFKGLGEYLVDKVKEGASGTSSNSEE